MSSTLGILVMSFKKSTLGELDKKNQDSSVLMLVTVES